MAIESERNEQLDECDGDGLYLGDIHTSGYGSRDDLLSGIGQCDRKWMWTGRE
jgi:hypothetical protein